MSTIFGSTFPASRAAVEARYPIVVVDVSFSFPPNVPKGVLFAATIKTALEQAILISMMPDTKWQLILVVQKLLHTVETYIWTLNLSEVVRVVHHPSYQLCTTTWGIRIVATNTLIRHTICREIWDIFHYHTYYSNETCKRPHLN